MADFHPIPTDPRFQDLTGHVFGRLTVLGYAGKKSRSSHWLCQCQCGNIKIVRRDHLASGNTSSCGCLRIEITGTRKRTHGKRESPEYQTWQGMKRRCYYCAGIGYKDYGGRGITVCDRWRDSFEAFLADMGLKPSPRHSIDRIDNSLGYCPENCRWATATEQASNTRTNRLLTFDGKSLIMRRWSECLGISEQAIWYRLEHGWSIEKALTTPVTNHA